MDHNYYKFQQSEIFMIESESKTLRSRHGCKISGPAHPEHTNSPTTESPMTRPRKKAIINSSEIIKQARNSPDRDKTYKKT